MALLTSHSLLRYFKSFVQDQDNILFDDEEYTRYLQNATINPTRRCSRTAWGVVTPTGTLDASGIYFYRRGCDGGDPYSGLMMDVQITTETALVDYTVDEGARRIYANPPATETRLSFEVTGFTVNLRKAAGQVFKDAAGKPSKTAIYLHSNGYTMDGRQAAEIMREHGRQRIGLTTGGF